MDTLSLTNLDNLVPIHTVCRTTLWFQHYDHCVRFVINEASALRKLSYTAIDKIISTRREWGRVRMHGKYNAGSWQKQWKPLTITEQDVNNLYYLCDFFQSENRDYKISISGDTVWVYTTDASLVNDICNLQIVKDISVSRVQLVGTPGTVKLKKSAHSYRSYMRSVTLTENIAQSVKNFLRSQEEISLSPSLKKWLSDQWKFTLDYYFIDHNEHSTINMLKLINTQLIRKTVPIVVDK